MREVQTLPHAVATVWVRIQAKGPLYANSELQTRYGLIDPILRALEWDVSDPNEVQVDFGIAGSGKADYVLMCHGAPCVVIEAKALGTPVANAVSQGIAYCNALQVPLLVCTDGNDWQIYDLNAPMISGFTPSWWINISNMKSSTSTTVFQQLLYLWKPVICSSLLQLPSVFVFSPAATSHTTPLPQPPSGVATSPSAVTPPPNAIPLPQLLNILNQQVLNQQVAFKPSKIYFPSGYKPIPIRYFKDIIKEVASYLIGLNKIPSNGVRHIVLPSGAIMSNPKYYTLLGGWYVYTHGNAIRVVKNAIYVLKACGVNPDSVYVS
jgi:hypothetical protein